MNKQIALTTLSCVGIIGSAVLVHIDTRKAVENGDPLNPKYYIKSASCTGATIALTAVSGAQSAKKIATLTGAAAGLTNYIGRYKNAAKELGYHDDIQKKMVGYKADPMYIGSQTKELINGDTMFYLPDLDLYFRTSFAEVRSAFYHLNRNLSLMQCCNLAMLCSFLGVDLEPEDKIKAESLGFGMDYLGGGCYWIDYDEIENYDDETGEKYYELWFVFKPDTLLEEEINMCGHTYKERGIE